MDNSSHSISNLLNAYLCLFIELRNSYNIIIELPSLYVFCCVYMIVNFDYLVVYIQYFNTPEHLFSRMVQSSRGGCSRRVHKIVYLAV